LLYPASSRVRMVCGSPSSLQSPFSRGTVSTIEAVEVPEDRNLVPDSPSVSVRLFQIISLSIGEQLGVRPFAPQLFLLSWSPKYRSAKSYPSLFVFFRSELNPPQLGWTGSASLSRVDAPDVWFHGARPLVPSSLARLDPCPR